MSEVSVHEAKTHLSRLLRRVELGEEIIIARSGKPVARLMAIEQPRRRQFGLDRGKFEVPDDFNDPSEEILRLFEGDDDEDPLR